MREFVVVIFLFVMIAMGWNQPFRHHADSLRRSFSNSGTPSPSPAGAVAQPTPMVIVPTTPAPHAATVAPNGSWRFEKTKMDEPYAKRATQNGR